MGAPRKHPDELRERATRMALEALADPDRSHGAIVRVAEQLGVLYDQADLHQGPASLWTKIGATPMIGQNDFPQDVFTQTDARALNAFALENRLGRMSMWSLNRDLTCSANYPDTSVVSDSCSGVVQDDISFAAILSDGFEGSPDDSAAARTQQEAEEQIVVDDPETSPYQVWSEHNAYTAGTKVVWRGNVYIAKWWNEGEAPDNPVLQDSETPWTLIGPVLAGETPAPTLEVPDDIAPAWTGSTTYEGGRSSCSTAPSTRPAGGPRVTAPRAPTSTRAPRPGGSSTTTR